MHVWRRWRVLDQLDQLVAEDDLALGDGDLLADAEVFRARRLAAAQRALDVVEVMFVAARKVLPALGHGLLDHLGVRQRAVRRRERLGGLARRELDEPGVARLDAGHVARRLLEERHAVLECLSPDVERVLLPGRVREAAVAVFLGRHRLALSGLEVEAPEVHRLLERGGLQLGLLFRRLREVEPPVPEGGAIVLRREPAGHLRKHGAELALDDVDLVHSLHYKESRRAIVSSASFAGSGRARSAISLRAAMKSLAWFTASSAISSPSRR